MKPAARGRIIGLGGSPLSGAVVLRLSGSIEVEHSRAPWCRDVLAYEKRPLLTHIQQFHPGTSPVFCNITNNI